MINKPTPMRMPIKEVDGNNSKITINISKVGIKTARVSEYCLIKGKSCRAYLNLVIANNLTNAA